MMYVFGRYESKGKQWAKNRPDHPVGLAPEDVSNMKSRQQAADSSIPGLVPAAKLGENHFMSKL